MTKYYHELRSHPDDARVVGWESRLAQLVRYESVRSLLRPGESVLDLGAGLGDLARYLARTNPEVRYSGVEARPEFVGRALQKQPPVVLQCADAFATAGLQKADVVAVIGALVDGNPLTDRTRRFTRLRTMIHAALAAAERLAIFVIARQDRLEADPSLSLDPALGGIEPAEIPWLLGLNAPYALMTDLLPNDYVLVVPRAPHPVPSMPSGAQLRTAALAHPDAKALCPEAHIRFYLAIGDTALAAKLLSEAEAHPTFSPDAAWHLLKARLALALGA